MQELVAIDERGTREKRALVTSYMHYLLPVLLLDQREEQLQEVATCLGTILAWQCDQHNILCVLQKWLKQGSSAVILSGECFSR